MLFFENDILNLFIYFSIHKHVCSYKHAHTIEKRGNHLKYHILEIMLGHQVVFSTVQVFDRLKLF